MSVQSLFACLDANHAPRRGTWLHRSIGHAHRRADALLLEAVREEREEPDSLPMHLRMRWAASPGSPIPDLLFDFAAEVNERLDELALKLGVKRDRELVYDVWSGQVDV